MVDRNVAVVKCCEQRRKRVDVGVPGASRRLNKKRKVASRESVAWKQNPVPESISTNIVDRTSLSDRKMGKGKGKNCVQVKDKKDKVEEKRMRA